jgi:hypothetical protein
MLNLKVDGAFQQLRGYAAHGVVIAKAAADVSLWEFGVNGRGQRLYV